jgi:uncharacterized protein YbjT (DUF2867 family)
MPMAWQSCKDHLALEEAIMESKQNLTLVLGGTGKTGRRVAQRLRERRVPVRLGSRAAAPPFDWTQPRTWAPALRGAGSVYVAYQPDLAAPGAAETLEAFTWTAAACGVTRIVLLSGRGEEAARPAERAVRVGGAGVTVLRAAFLCQNFSEGLFLGGVRSGELGFPAGDVAEPFVDADDVADVAVAALLDAAHAARTYELTGPRLLTFAEACAEIAAAAGRALRYVPVSKAAYVAALAPVLPPGEAAFLGDLFERLLDGHNAHLDDGVARVLGRAPRDFRDYARAAAATRVWAVPESAAAV